MRITYRKKNVREYWASRWADIPADSPMQNTTKYPLKYAEMTIANGNGKILEAGCGAGRILRYYHERGYDIFGMDFIFSAVQKLNKADPSLKIIVGDVSCLAYEDCSFRYLLAFGLYHNLEYGLLDTLHESGRVLEKGGYLCASFRADNLQTKLNDSLAQLSFSNLIFKSVDRYFHKMNLTKSEFKKLLIEAGFEIELIEPVENMPILYKFSYFRDIGHKVFDERRARSEGYKLSLIGGKIQRFLMKYFADQFCNLYVVIARKL